MKGMPAKPASYFVRARAKLDDSRHYITTRREKSSIDLTKDKI